MQVEVKMFMKFRKYLPPDTENDKAVITLDEGATLLDLRSALGIPPDEHGGTVIDGVAYPEDSVHKLKDGDSIGFFASVAGG